MPGRSAPSILPTKPGALPSVSHGLREAVHACTHMHSGIMSWVHVPECAVLEGLLFHRRVGAKLILQPGVY